MNLPPKAHFEGDLVLRAFKPSELRWVDGSTQLYRLEKPFAFVSPKYGRIEAAAGTVTDFASIPGFAHWFMDSDHRAILFGSVIHDYLYAIAGEIGDGRKFTRQEADEILREAMQVCGASKLQTAIVYRALRLGGAGSWGN